MILDDVEGAVVRNVTSDLKHLLPHPGRKVATVLSVVTTTATDGVHTATIDLKTADPGAAHDCASGWILVKTGDKVLAQVQMIHGQAIASWVMPLHTGPGVTITYTGDSSFAPTTRALAL